MLSRECGASRQVQEQEETRGGDDRVGTFPAFPRAAIKRESREPKAESRKRPERGVTPSRELRNAPGSTGGGDICELNERWASVGAEAAVDRINPGNYRGSRRDKRA